uniref:Uncharacterized protein n=1 Tax=viral metagenome TaxID=1070528 RepID=A0A6C0E1C7_9ZZZZ
MEVTIQLTDDNGKKTLVKVDKIKFQKMIFLFNTLEEGWTIKKKSDSYYLLKNHEGKKEVFLESYLSTFMQDVLDINKILL